MPGQSPVPVPSAKVSELIFIRVALFKVLKLLLSYIFRAYCLPFSVRNSSMNAKFLWGLPSVVPVVATVVSLLFKNVVSLIVNACTSSVLLADR